MDDPVGGDIRSALGSVSITRRLLEDGLKVDETVDMGRLREVEELLQKALDVWGGVLG